MNKYTDKVKKEYNSIEIPNELEKKVRLGIERGKKDSIENRAMKPYRYIFRTGGVAAAAALLAITLLANVNPGMANAMENVPILGAITHVVTFSSYKSQDNEMSADIKIPTVSSMPSSKNGVDELNKTVKEYTDQIIAAYKSDVKATDGSGKEAVNTDYSVITDNNTLFSLRINTDISMADTNKTVKIYHVDKKTDKLITLQDLFTDDSYITLISRNIKKQMRANMKKDSSLSYFIDDGMGDADFKHIEKNTNFYIDKNGSLNIVFDKYEAAPGYMGIVEFTIPTSVINDIVKDGYLK